MSVTCNAIECNSGKIDLESLLVSLFAKNASGCVGLKLVEIGDTDCNNLTALPECGTFLTLEQVLKMAIVDDGCGGFALGVYKLTV